MRLSILYRGPLSSCNYACPYCPFAKHAETAEELAVDRAALERFIQRVAELSHIEIGILFTPWGEALIRSWYQDALIQLTQLPHIWRAAIQTNLSCPLAWVEKANKAKLGLWVTYHPGEITRERFLNKAMDLHSRNVKFSVGVVGLKEHQQEIEELRKQLPEDVYLWINAYKDQPEYYTEQEINHLEQIDPWFRTNTIRHPSKGRPCRAGSEAISVDGNGVTRRCHFIKHPIGNFYTDDLEAMLQEQACTNETCGCHIGYIHMPELGMYEVYGDGLLERIPLGKGDFPQNRTE